MPTILEISEHLSEAARCWEVSSESKIPDVFQNLKSRHTEPEYHRGVRSAFLAPHPPSWTLHRRAGGAAGHKDEAAADNAPAGSARQPARHPRRRRGIASPAPTFRFLVSLRKVAAALALKALKKVVLRGGAPSIEIRKVRHRPVRHRPRASRSDASAQLPQLPQSFHSRGDCGSSEARGSIAFLAPPGLVGGSWACRPGRRHRGSAPVGSVRSRQGIKTAARAPTSRSPARATIGLPN